ncbi:MAG: hypothetical protein KBD37_03780 [Burkholderiales bacterium]|nr:hypothetical protein [Burkholderiales bacterium]
MNHGNIKYKIFHNIDAIVEQLNYKLGRLLGKRDQRPSNKNKKISNLVFSILILGCSLLLWLATGFYYLGENQFGIILQNGKIVKVVKGINVGFTAPYPFGSIAVLDATISDFIDLNKMGLTNGNFTILSRDLRQIKVDAKFNYQVVDPAKLFKTALQMQSNLDNIIAWSLQDQLRDYFISESNNEILKANLTVVANEIRSAVNQRLAVNGIKIIKLNINSLTELNNSPDYLAIEENKPTPATGKPNIAVELLQQANNFKQDRINQTHAEIRQFEKLSAQYRLTPNAVVQQMYYTALEEIPTNQLERYPLLNLNLSELISLAQSKMIEDTPPAKQPLRQRHFGREVSRERGDVFGDNE